MSENLVVGGTTYNNVDYVCITNEAGEEVNYYQGLTEEDKKEIASMVDEADIPEYWESEIKTKANAIQKAMEKAGRNKSAFLWYTDAHWVNGNSKVSPKLLNYLYEKQTEICKKQTIQSHRFDNFFIYKTVKKA